MRSMKKYFPDCPSTIKYFSDLIQVLYDSRQAFSPTIYVVAPSKITLYYSADPGFHWNLSRVTDLSGSHYPSQVADLSRVK